MRRREIKLKVRHMSNPFETFLTDTLTLRNAGGIEHPGIQASVSDQKITIFDVSMHVEPNDVLIRSLPNGRSEEFIVEDAIYSTAFHSIPAHWSIKYRRRSQQARTPHNVTYNVNGQNSRININSHDQSRNVAHAQSQQVFADMRHAVLQQLPSSPDRDRLLERIEQLEQAHGMPGFLSHYQEFITAAANHMTVLSPFFPALAQLLS